MFRFTSIDVPEPERTLIFSLVSREAPTERSHEPWSTREPIFKKFPNDTQGKPQFKLFWVQKSNNREEEEMSVLKTVKFCAITGVRCVLT